jgi:DNA-directed RNA polymerase specialized sigma24 family protein
MSYGELIIALEVLALGVAAVLWLRKQASVKPAPIVAQEMRQSRSVRRARPQRLLVRCILMDENEVETHAVLELPKHQREPILMHDGQAYSAANVTSEGFVYRRMT